MKLKTILELIVLLFLTASIPLTIYLAGQTQDLRGKAIAPPVVLTIDVADATTLSRNWQNLAQGGEVPVPQLPAVVGELGALSPRYIRIDHIFDAYEVLKRDQKGELWFDFSLLDREVDAIVKTGAIPFFSLSYLPQDIEDPNNKGRPLFNQWEALVAQTVAHYSGKRGKNLQNVYYEVYNEPDLFGKWGVEEYTALYEFSLKGVLEATDTQPFFVGGPALGYFDPTFIRTFLTLVSERHLRLDFISWHVYSTQPAKIANDAKSLDMLLQNFPTLQKPQKIISEWGSFPQKHLWNDTLYGASHLVATVARSLDAAEMLFHFEIKDGVNDTDQKFFGGWGILTNEAFGVEKKPRYQALWLLNKLKPNRYSISGGDEKTYAIASGENAADLTLLLTRYSFGSDGLASNVSLRFINMLSGVYQVAKTELHRAGLSPSENIATFTIEKNEGSFDIAPASDAVTALNITRLSTATHKTSGLTEDPHDQAASVSPAVSLVYTIPSQPNPLTTTVSFALRSNVPLTQLPDSVYAQSSNDSGSITLSKETEGFAAILTLSATKNGEKSTVSLPLSPSDAPGWHTVSLAFDNTRALLSLTLDEDVLQGSLPKGVGLGKQFSIGGFDGSIDNVAVSVDGKLLFSDTF